MEYQPGSWFWISDVYIFTASGRRFSWKSTKRPVILATSFGPDATLYPRSASGKGIRHRAHRHGANERPCDIRKDGWVVREPVAVDSSLLDETSFSCAEPDGTGLLEAIHQASGARRS